MSDRRKRQGSESATGTVFPITIDVRDVRTGQTRKEQRFVAEFRSVDHRGKLRTYRSRHTTAPKAWAAMPDLQARAATGKLPPKRAAEEAQTVAEFIKAWHGRRVKLGTIRSTTASNEARHVKRIGETELGSLLLRSVDADDVKRFLRQLEDILPKAARTRQQCFQVVLGAFKEAGRASILADVTRPKAPKPETSSFTPGELSAILAACEKPLPGDTLVDWEFAALVWFLARTGARIGEAQALRWRALDIREGTARIDSSAFEEKGQGVLIGETKSAQPRTVHLPPALVTRLQALRARFAPIPMDQADRFVFGCEDGMKPFRRSNMLRRRWHILLDALKLERCGFHRLRHSFASLSIAGGADVATVSHALGHADAGFTLKVYTHAQPNLQAAAAERLDALLEAAAQAVEK